MTNKMRNQGKKTEEKMNTTGLSLWAVHVLARLLHFFEVKLHMCASDLMQRKKDKATLHESKTPCRSYTTNYLHGKEKKTKQKWADAVRWENER